MDLKPPDRTDGEGEATAPSGVVEHEVPQQQAPVPDPRWPYLGRWSASPETPPSLMEKTEPKAPPAVDIAPPPVDTAPPHASGTTVVPSLATETTAAPQTTVIHPPLTGEADLLKHVVPPTALETETVSPTSESVAVQIALTETFSTTHEGSREVPVSFEDNNQSPDPEVNQLHQPPIPQVKPPTIPADVLAQAPGKFVPSLGSWAKPLFFKPPVTPPEPTTPRDYDPAIVGNQLAALWPTLNDEILNKQSKGKYPSRTFQPPIEKLPPPELKADGSLRFPWAARLSAQSRNLYRAATPTYRLDGTPEVSIPSKVLKLGPENKDEYIIGKFHKCSLPPGGLVHAVVNKIWGRSCMISCKKLGDSSFMFHIPHQPTRQWVIQRGVWHIDDCLLFVLPWTPEGSFKVPEISTLPVWATLKNVPNCCYSRLGISHVASGLGEPILTHKPRLDPTSMGEAKILVEMELDKNFPKIIALDDKQGNIFLVNVEYTWIPSMCERCGNLGHKAKRCLLPATVQVSASASPSTNTSSAVPVVDINTILQQKDNDSPPSVHQEYLHVNESNSPSALDGAALEPQKNIKVIEGLFSELETTQALQPTFQPENTTVPPNFVPTFSTLVDSQSTPTAALIMETSPSTVINTEVRETPAVDPLTTTHINFGFESPSQFKGFGDVDEVVTGTSSINLTRGGRETKPPIKYQEMEWKTARGKGKRGRRGRGS